MSAKLSSDPACKTGERRSLAAMSIKAPRHKSQARMALRPQVLSAGTGLWGAPLSDDGTWIWWQVQDKVVGLAPTLKPMPLVISAVGPDPTLAQRIASIAHHEKSD